MLAQINITTIKNVFIIAFMCVLATPAFSQDEERRDKRLFLTLGGMLRSAELIDQEVTIANSYGMLDRMKPGLNLGAMFQIKPRFSIGYNSNLRYGVLYYRDGFITEPVKEFMSDHNVMAIYRISNQDSKFGYSLGLGHSWINTGKRYSFQAINGAYLHHKVNFSTFDLIASFSFKRFHLEPKLMFNYSDTNYTLDLGHKDLRMWLNLRAYYSLGIF
jgi:hypothetical protein